MRLLLINYEYPPVGAGAATATAEMARAAVRQGHELTVLTAAFGGNAGWSRDGDVALRRVASRRERADQSSVREMASFVLHAAAALPGVVRRARPDACIVFFSVPCGPLGLMFRCIARRPYIVSLRGGDVPGTEPQLDRMHRRLRWIRRLVLSKAAAVVANSPGLARLSETADPIAVKFIANGVDLERFHPAADPPAGPLRFLFVGRLNEQKNVALLLKACARLASESVEPFRVSIVGDGPLRESLRALASSLHLDDRIEWTPWLPRERMPDVYRAAHCVVNPSHYEGMPNVVLEAMACGVPAIVSDVAGNRDVVEHGVTGRIVAHNSIDDLVREMRAALSDRGELRPLGTAARHRVEERYSWDAATARFIDLLRTGGNPDNEQLSPLQQDRGLRG